jgi:hypothetical protein
MAETKGEADEQNGSADRPTCKKPYKRPTFQFERVFETMALSCGKMNATEFQCRFNRKTS